MSKKKCANIQQCAHLVLQRWIVEREQQFQTSIKLILAETTVMVAKQLTLAAAMIKKLGLLTRDRSGRGLHQDGQSLLSEKERLLLGMELQAWCE